MDSDRVAKRPLMSEEVRILPFTVESRLYIQSFFAFLLEDICLLPQNLVGFQSCYGLFDHVDELLREVGHGDKGLSSDGIFSGAS